MTSIPSSVPARYHLTSDAAMYLDVTEMDQAVARHLGGDWGNASAKLKEHNEHALAHGGRLLSVHTSRKDVTFLVTSDAKSGVPLVTLPKKKV